MTDRGKEGVWRSWKAAGCWIAGRGARTGGWECGEGMLMRPGRDVVEGKGIWEDRDAEKGDSNENAEKVRKIGDTWQFQPAAAK